MRQASWSLTPLSIMLDRNIHPLLIYQKQEKSGFTSTKIKKNFLLLRPFALNFLNKFLALPLDKFWLRPWT